VEGDIERIRKRKKKKKWGYCSKNKRKGSFIDPPAKLPAN
jgi:hypothetical protein